MVRVLRNRSGRKDAVTAAVVETLEQRKMLASFQGAYLFYNNSAWDGNSSAINDADSAAIATDKVPLRELQKASFANYSSYSRGINGVMVDIKSTEGTPTLADFQFKVGNANTDPFQWSAAPTPTGFSFRKGKGAGGTDRVVFTWADGAIKGKWLQVTTLPTSRTGLFQKEVVYFGSAIGEVGNVANSTRVDAADELKIRSNPRSLLNPAPIDNPYDLNRDKKVDAADQLIARSNTTSFLTDLKLVTAPPVPISNLAVEYYSSSEIRLTWRQHSAVETGYSIKVTDSPTGTFKELGTVPADITGALITRLHPGATYYFKVEPILNNPPSGVMPVAAPTVTVTMPEATRSGSNFRWYNVSLPKTAITKGEAGYTGTGSASVVHALVGAESEVAAVLQAISGSATITNYNGQQRQYTIPTITLGSQVVPVSSAYKFGTVVNGQFQYQEFVNNAWTTKTAVGFGPLGTSPGGIPVANGDKILSLEDTFEWTNQDLDFDDFFWKVSISYAPINLSVTGTTEANEETIGRFVQVNDNADEQNREFSGGWRLDNEPDAINGDRIVSSDSQLVAADLFVGVLGGTWSLTFSERAKVWRNDGSGNYVQIVSGQPYSVTTAPQTIPLLIEGIAASDAVNDVELLATFTPATGNATTDRVLLTVAGVDIDVDSDNDNFFNLPERDANEEAMESDPASSGKQVYVNDDDDDGDGVIDNVDGYNRDLNNLTDGTTAGETFVPVIVQANARFDLSSMMFRVSYSSSNPLASGATAEAGLRLWTKAGHEPRDGRSVKNGGDFLAPGEYTATELGLATDRTLRTMWLEAAGMLASPNQTIRIEVDPDGAGSAGYELVDEVKVLIRASADRGASITGYKWEDVNGNHIRDKSSAQGEPPNLVYVIDVSGSTEVEFAGYEDIGEINNDGNSNSILDAELASFIELTKYYLTPSLGYAGQSRVSIVTFAGTAQYLDMDDSVKGIQASGPLSPAIIEKLSGIQNVRNTPGGDDGTKYVQALDAIEDVVAATGLPRNKVNVIFLSDGYPNPDNVAEYTVRARQLLDTGVQVNAFGAGGGARLAPLNIVATGSPDPDAGAPDSPVRGRAEIFYTRDDLKAHFEDGAFKYLEPTRRGFRVYVDLDNDGQFDAGTQEEQFSSITDQFGNYSITGLPPGQYTVREVPQDNWQQTTPDPVAEGGAFTITVAGTSIYTGLNFGNQRSSPLPVVDLDIDTDNDPLTIRTQAEDDIEGNPSLSGKIIDVNSNDTDSDGTADWIDFNGIAGEQFVPLTVDLSDLDSIEHALVTLLYSGPEASAALNLPQDGITLRIWRKDGNQVRGVADYVVPGKPYTASELGFTESSRVVTLFVEALSPVNPQRAIVLQVRPDTTQTTGVIVEDTVYIQPRGLNQLPEFDSRPPESFDLPGVPHSARGAASPDGIVLNFDFDDPNERTFDVTVTVPAAAVSVPAVDVFFLIDDTGSFSGVWNDFAGEIESVADSVQSAFPHVSFGFGVGRFEEYGQFAGGNFPFALNLPIVEAKRDGFSTALTAAFGRSSDGLGGDGPETLVEALYQIATGAGFDGDDDGSRLGSGPAGAIPTQTDPGSTGDVPPFNTYVENLSEDMLSPSGSTGGVGFRRGALPIVIVATDIGTAYEPEAPGTTHIRGRDGTSVPFDEFAANGRDTTPGGRGARIQATVDALNALGVSVIGLGAGDGPTSVLKALAKVTGAVNNGDAITLSSGNIGTGDPLYFPINSETSGDIAKAMRAAIGAAVVNGTTDLEVISSDPNVEVLVTAPTSLAALQGQPIAITLKFTEPPQSKGFDLLFVKKDSGTVYASVPVTINTDYVYAPISAHDDDKDPVRIEIDTDGVLDPQGNPVPSTMYELRTNADDGKGVFILKSPLPGTYTVTLWARDTVHNVRTSQVFEIDVRTQNEGNSTPQIDAITPQVAVASQAFTLQIAADDTNASDELTYFLFNAPDGMSISRETGLVTWTPGKDQIGKYEVEVLVHDGSGGRASRTFTIVAKAAAVPNRNPIVVSTDRTLAAAEQLYSYEVVVVDADRDDLAFSAVSVPAGMQIDVATGAITWIPSASQVGQYVVEFQVEDSQGGVTLHSYSLTVALKPSTPANVSVSTASDSRLFVDWDAVPGADGYRVYRGNSKNGPWISLSEDLLSADAVLDENLNPSTAYYYTITAVNDGVESDRSVPVAATTAATDLAPQTPEGFAAALVPGGVKLMWELSSEKDVVGYALYKKAAGETEPSPLAFVKQGTSEYVDSSASAVAGTTYYLWSVDLEFNGSDEPATATVATAATPVITGVTSSVVDSRSRTLTATLQNTSLAADTRYYWYVIDGPEGAPGVNFTDNGSNEAMSTTATFGMAGDYHIGVVAVHASGSEYAFELSGAVTLDQRAQRLFISPWRATVGTGGTLGLQAIGAIDQFGYSYTPTGVTYALGTGSESEGSITGSVYTAGSFTGDDTIVATLDDATATIEVHVTSNGAGVLYGSYAVISGPEGLEYSGAVGAFSDTLAGTQLSEYYAEVTWGDEGPTDPADSTSNGQLTLQQAVDGSIRVLGAHAYADTGVFPLTVTLRHTPTNRTVVLTDGSATVLDASVAGTGQSLNAQIGVELSNAVLAEFTDENAFSAAEDFAARVDWGDGTPIDTSATIEKQPDGTYVVMGTHTYRSRGSLNIRVYLSDAHDGTQLAITSTASITGGAAATPTNVRAERLNSSQIYLEWAKNEEYGVYVVWRQELDSNGDPVGDRERMLAPGDLPFFEDKPTLFWTVDQNLPAGKRFRYTVQLINRFGEVSAESDPVEDSTRAQPAPPTSVAAHATGRIVRVSWDDPADATVQGWQILRSTSEAGTYALVHPADQIAGTPEFFDYSAESNTTYWYKVVAVSVDNVQSSPSAGAVVTTGLGIGVPTAPTGVGAGYAGRGRVGVVWNAVNASNLLGYDVYRGSTADFRPSAATLLNSSAEAWYVDDAVAPGTYFYKIIAIVDDGEGNELSSQPSDSASVDTSSEPSNPPVAPGALTGTVGAGGVTLHWKDLSTTEAEFRIYRLEDGDDPVTGWIEAGRVTANVTQFVDDDVVPGNRYSYKVGAFNYGSNPTDPNESTAQVAFSNQVGPLDIPNDGSQPIAPGTPTLVSKTHNSIELSWPQESGLTYQVYRRSGTSPFGRVSTSPINGASFADTGLLASTSYEYAIRAVSAVGSKSALSASLTVTTDAPATTLEAVAIIASPATDSVPTVVGGSSASLTVADNRLKSRTVIELLVGDYNAAATPAWSLKLRPLNSSGQAVPAQDILLRNATGAIGTLDGLKAAPAFVLDPTNYATGDYQLVLTVNGSERATRRVTLFSEVKSGNLTLPVTDISVPVPGSAPIEVRRVYDSQRANELLDFGYGWRLDYATSVMKTTARPIDSQANSPVGFRAGDIVYITLPGGRQHAFQFWPVPGNFNPYGGSGLANPYGSPVYASQLWVQFVAVDGSDAVLRMDGDINELNSNDRISLSKNGEGFYDAFVPGKPFNPGNSEYSGRVHLTYPDGASYTIDSRSGALISFADPNGNVTDYSNPNGIVSGNTKLKITREPGTNLIQKIEVVDTLNGDQPVGAPVLYDYYKNGDSDNPGNLKTNDLRRVTSRGSKTQTYDYTDPINPRLLSSVSDARNKVVLRAFYDANSRLIELRDATGKSVPINNGAFDGSRIVSASQDLAGNEIETITNDRGDVVREIRKVVDPETGDVSYSITVKEYQYYNAANDSSQFGRDLVFMLNQSKLDRKTGILQQSALVGVKEYAPFVISGADVTADRYRASPTIVKSSVEFYTTSDRIDPSGKQIRSQTTYGVDADGNQIARTTLFELYNSLGKPQKVTDPFGLVTYLKYDSKGNLLWSANQFGEGIRSTYNAKGEILSTYRVFVANPSSSLNDAAPYGGVADLAKVSENAYYADSASVPAATRGRLMWSENERGNRTFYAYDVNGNLAITARLWDNPSPTGADRWVVNETIYNADGQATGTNEIVYADAGGDRLFSWSLNTATNRVIVGEGTAVRASRATSATEYRSTGEVASSQDQYQIGTAYQTESRYDDRGQVLETAYADGTISQSVYDVMGRVILSVDRYVPGQTDAILGTRTVFDSLGRAVQTFRVQLSKLASGKVVDVVASSTAETYKVAAVSASAGLEAEDPNAADKIWMLAESFSTYISTSRTIYDQEGRVVETVDPTGLRTGNVYYVNGQLRWSGTLDDNADADWFEQLPPSPSQAESFYGAFFKQQDGHTLWTKYAYDLDTSSYNADRYDSVIDALGRETRTYKDLQGRVIRTVFADGSYTETLYGVSDQKVSTGLDIKTPAELTVPTGGRHEVRIEQRKDGDPDVATHYVYDVSEQLIGIWLPAVIDATATDNPATPSLDERLKRPHWTYTYDDNGNQTAQTDPNGHTTTFEYDELGMRINRTLPADSDSDTSNDTEHWTYDAFDRVLTHVDFKGQTTAYAYSTDARHGGRLTSEYRFDAGVAALDSNGAIRATAATERTDYDYDGLGRQQSVYEYSAGNFVTDSHHAIYEYDEMTGGITRITSTEGVINHAYDPVTGQLIRTWTTQNDTAYGYDGFGRLEHVYAVVVSGVRAGAGSITFVGFDPQTREPTFSGGTPGMTAYLYNALGSLDVTIEDMGTTSTDDDLIHDYDYDTLNRLAKLTVKQGTGDRLLEQDFTYYNNGQKRDVIEKIDDGDPATPFSTVKVGWTYDDNGRLLTEDRDESNDGIQNGGDYLDTYAFDLAGNRHTKTHDAVGSDDDSTVISEFNDRDQLVRSGADDNLNGVLEAGEVDTTINYDANGSTVSETSGASTKRFVWDLRNRMVGFNANGNVDANGDMLTDEGDATFSYDHNGVRVGKTVITSTGADVTKFLQDTNNPTGYSQVLEERLNNALIRSYRIGNDVIAQADGTTARVFIYDGGGSVRGLVDGTGQPITSELYAYDAFGNIVQSSEAVQPLSALLYRGELLDFTTGLYVLRARYFSPSKGTFGQQDAYEGQIGLPSTLHAYIYSNANPVAFLDPSGYVSTTLGTKVHSYLSRQFESAGGAVPGSLRYGNRWVSTILRAVAPGWYPRIPFRPDAVEIYSGIGIIRYGDVYEFKPGPVSLLTNPSLFVSESLAAASQLGSYLTLLAAAPSVTWRAGFQLWPGFKVWPTFTHALMPPGTQLVTFNEYSLVEGVVFYEFLPTEEALRLAASAAASLATGYIAKVALETAGRRLAVTAGARLADLGARLGIAFFNSLLAKV